MKKKTLRKLTLSAVTLGVAALSLTSTTYAWFTTNGKAEAKGISGTVSSPDLLMLIKSPTGWTNSTPVYDGTVVWPEDTSASTFTSSETKNATFAQTTKLVNENGNGGNRDKLSPVSIASSELANTTNKNIKTVTFKQLNNASTPHTEGDALITAESYLHYQVVISVSGLEAGKTYDVNMVLPKINDTAVEQYLLVDAGDYAKAGSTIKVSLADALSLGIKNTIIGSTGNTTYGVDKGGTVDTIATDNGGFYHAVAEVDTLTIKGSSDEQGKKGDAITYYKNVYGLTESFVKPTECSTSDNNNKGYEDLYTKVSTGNNASNESYFSNWTSSYPKTIYSVTGTKDGSFVCVTDLYFFIDGWDYQCFNAIGGQSVFATTNVEQSITFTCKEHTN